MKVYHGTISTCAENIIKNGINLKKGKSYVDFDLIPLQAKGSL